MIKKLSALFSGHTSFYRFAAVGSSCFIIEYLLFTFLHILVGDNDYRLLYLNVTGIFIANTISYMTGAFLSFHFNRKWTFRSDGNKTYQLGKFMLLFFVNIFVSNWLIHFLDDNIRLNPQIGKLISSLIICIWNYFVNKFIVFKK